MTVVGVRVKNIAHIDGISRTRATRSFRVSGVLRDSGPWNPWEQLLEEEFDNPLTDGAPPPSLQTFYFREAVEVQFLRFDLDSYWGDIGGGLDYFDVITVSELCQSIEMDSCPPYDCRSPAPLIEEHPGVKCQCRHNCTEPASNAATATVTVLVLLFLALAFLLIFLT